MLDPRLGWYRLYSIVKALASWSDGPADVRSSTDLDEWLLPGSLPA